MRKWLLAPALLLATPLWAQTLTFDSSPILQSYGDTAGIDVSYHSLTGNGNSSESYSGLYQYGYGYGNLTGVVWGGNGDAVGVPEIRFASLDASAAVNLTSFDAASFGSAARSSDFRVYDLDYNLLWDSGVVTLAAGHTTFDVTLSAIGGIILQWGPNGYNVGLDNIAYSGGGAAHVRATETAVPEPLTWMMMLAGIGAVGVAMRRNRHFATA